MATRDISALSFVFLICSHNSNCPQGKYQGTCPFLKRLPQIAHAWSSPHDHFCFFISTFDFHESISKSAATRVKSFAYAISLHPPAFQPLELLHKREIHSTGPNTDPCITPIVWFINIFMPTCIFFFPKYFLKLVIILPPMILLQLLTRLNIHCTASTAELSFRKPICLWARPLSS